MVSLLPRLRILYFSLCIFPLFVSSCAKRFVIQQQTHELLPINDGILPDSSFVRHYLPYKEQLEAEMNRVIGHAPISLTKPGNSPETLLGNFFTDALIEEGRKIHPHIDVSFGTKGGLRTEIAKGDITIGKVFELMPFENELVVLELTGEGIQRLAQFIAASNGQPVSGIEIDIVNESPTNIRIGGKPFDESKTYHLLTYDYLANGGDDMRGLDNPVNRYDLGIKVREVLIQYIEQRTTEGKPITAQLDGRIKQIK